MKTAIIQLWEILYEDRKIQSDGCSLHIDKESLERYLKISERQENEQPVGLYTEVDIKESIYNTLVYTNSIRLSEIEMNNLLGLKEIVPIV